jgi:hypothetical protein
MVVVVVMVIVVMVIAVRVIVVMVMVVIVMVVMVMMVEMTIDKRRLMKCMQYDKFASFCNLIVHTVTAT